MASTVAFETSQSGKVLSVKPSARSRPWSVLLGGFFTAVLYAVCLPGSPADAAELMAAARASIQAADAQRHVAALAEIGRAHV